MASDQDKDPRHHTQKLKGELDGMIEHLREDIGKVECEKAKVLFETAAEVLTGLKTSFEHFEEKSEPAMQ